MVYKSSKSTQERKDLKRKHIIDTAVKVFVLKGYYGASVKDIVEEADISVGTFYFYFKNKEELFETLYVELSEELFERTIFKAMQNINNKIDLGFSRAITFFLKVIDLNRPLAKIMLIEAVGLNPKFEARRAEVTKKCVNYTFDGLKEIEAFGSLSIPDIKIGSTALMGTLYGVIMEWLQEDNGSNLTDYAYTLIIYNLQALRIDYNVDQVKLGIEQILNKELICEE